MCLINLKKNRKISQFTFHVCSRIKKKTPKIFPVLLFACWELSRVNSFYFFFFLWGSRRPYWKCLVALICMIVYLNLEPILLVFSLELNACRFQLSPMHVHSYYYTQRSVVRVKGNNDDIWWTYWDEKSWYELDLSCFCKYDDSSFLIQLLWSKHICNDI